MSRYKWIDNDDITKLIEEVSIDILDIYSKTPDAYTVNLETADEATVLVYTLNWGYDHIKNKRWPKQHTERIKKDLLKKIEQLGSDLIEYGLIDVHYDHLLKIKAAVKEKKVWTQKQYISSLKKYAKSEFKSLGTSEKRIRDVTRFIGDTLICIDHNPTKYKKLLSPLVNKYC